MTEGKAHQVIVMTINKKRIVTTCLVVTALWWNVRLALPQEAKDPRQTDPYYKTYGGWELRPLESARKHGKLIFQSDFSASGLDRDWRADGVSVELKDGSAVLSVAPERVAAKKEYGALWAKTPFAQPMMVEIDFTLAASTPHDANIYWGQKMPSIENLGKEQECYVVGYFGWGGRCSGFEGCKCGGYGIAGVGDPKPDTRYHGNWIIKDKLQCLYLDGGLVVSSNTPVPPPESGYLGLSVYQSKVTFHSLKVFSLGSKKK